MPLLPAPLFPGTSPLPAPGQQPPGRAALRMATLLVLPSLVVALVLGQLLLPRVVFLAPGLQAQAGGGSLEGSAATFQGFVYPWTRDKQGGGYATPASLTNMQSQASLFHMNTVVIPVVADMPARGDSVLLWRADQQNNKHTLPEADYLKAIKDARKAGLVPILELQVRQQDALSFGDETPSLVGKPWFDMRGDKSFSLNGREVNAAEMERGWFDNYAAFAAHFALISQQNHLPYFIIGNQLNNVTTDGDKTLRKNPANGIVDLPGESNTCIGRRDCEWRHVIHAIKSKTFTTYGGQQAAGGEYTGKLIYAANWTGATAGAQDPEFQVISWWDAVDIIGIDAFFPLTQNKADVDPTELVAAWHGKGTNLGGQGDIFGRIQKVADTFHRQVLFTAAGYESVAGSNSSPLHSNITVTQDMNEQLNDMSALLQTFTAAPWWAGVMWYADEPIAPRTSQPNWQQNSNWAGTTLENSKAAGKFLNSIYKPHPLPCAC